MKAFTTLAVRNSRLEELHANDGPVKSSGIEGITTVTLPPLSHLIAARRQHPLSDGSYSRIFTGLDAEYPRAWACLSALRQALRNGGRVGYRTPIAPLPELPRASETTEAPPSEGLLSATGEPAGVVLSAIDPRFDQMAINHMKKAKGGGLLLGLASLSRMSRDSRKLLRLLDFFLAYQTKIITTNTLFTSKEVYVRGKRLVKPDSWDDMSGLRNLQGISGTHRKTVEAYIRSVSLT